MTPAAYAQLGAMPMLMITGQKLIVQENLKSVPLDELYPAQTTREPVSINKAG